MRTGLAISAVAHAAVLLIGLVTVSTKPLDAPPVDSMPVDIMSMADFSRITAGDRSAPKAETPRPLVEKVAPSKPAEDLTAKVVDKPDIITASATPTPPPPEPQREVKPPEPKPPEVKPPEPKAAAKPEKSEPKPDTKPAPKVDAISEMLKKDDKKKPEPKKEAAPQPKPQPPQPKFDRQQIAALLDKRDPQRQAAAGDVLNRTPALGAPTGTAMTLSQNEIDALRARLRECWLLPAGAADAKDLAVEVRIQLRQDGSLAAEPALVRRGANPYFQVAAESALRAVRRCAPFTFLPVAKYEVWRDIEVTFDPRDMFRG